MWFPCPFYIHINTSFGGFEGCWIHLKWSQVMIHTLYDPWYPLILIVHGVDWHWNCSKSVQPSGFYESKHSIRGFWRVLNPSRVVPTHDSYMTIWSWYPLILLIRRVDRHWNCSNSIQPCPFYGSKHSIRGFGSVLNSARVVPIHESYIAPWSMVPSHP